MCIAIIKPAGVELPDANTFANCWRSNSDGAGICYPCNGGIQIYKGLKTLEEFMDAIEMLRALDPNIERGLMFLHFRIGTHGGRTDPKHTHPFPIGMDQEAMEALCKVTQTPVLMHNGIISDYGYDKGVSDTMAFARDAMPFFMDHLDDPNALRAIRSIIGTDRLAVMTPSGAVTRIGHWLEVNGCFYSNDGYRDIGRTGFRNYGCTTVGSLDREGDWEQDWYGRWNKLVDDATPDLEEKKIPKVDELWSDLVYEEFCETFAKQTEAWAIIAVQGKIDMQALKAEAHIYDTDGDDADTFARDAWMTLQFLSGGLPLSEFEEYVYYERALDDDDDEEAPKVFEGEFVTIDGQEVVS
ncbi:MAG: hypothetical protein IPM06_18705 [Rhizobiales bacterium]|nr:hypothetical protein [Hyphomicrobiales bacterium]